MSDHPKDNPQFTDSQVYQWAVKKFGSTSKAKKYLAGKKSQKEGKKKKRK